MASLGGSAHLLSSKLNVAQVLTAAQTELLELLGDPATKKVGGVRSQGATCSEASQPPSCIPTASTVSHTQVLVWDQDLIRPMSLIADAPFIRRGGISKMVRLPLTALTEQYPDAVEYLFLVRPSLSIVDMVVEAIRYGMEPPDDPLITGVLPSIELSLLHFRTSKKKNEKTFIVAFTPNKAEHCVTKLKVEELSLGPYVSWYCCRSMGLSTAARPLSGSSSRSTTWTSSLWTAISSPSTYPQPSKCVALKWLQL